MELLSQLAGWLARRKKKAGTSGASAAETGKWGEGIAADFLRGKGYCIVGRNVRPDRRHDEIDLVARDNAWIVFVEVKTRAYEWKGIQPADAVNAKKRHALNRAAIAYLRKARFPQKLYRFDVVEVIGSEGDAAKPIVRHMESAFPFEERYNLAIP